MKTIIRLIPVFLLTLTLVVSLVPAVSAEQASVAEVSDGAEPLLGAAAAEEPAAEKKGISERLSAWFVEHLPGLPPELVCFIVSLFPILELRGGLIAASLLNVNFIKAFIICYVGNMLPIPFILLLIKKIFAWMKKFKGLDRIAEKLEARGVKNRDKVLKYETWGLLAFVAIPLPGTGGWTGALISAMLDLDIKKSLGVIAIGVLIAGIIMSLITYGIPFIVSSIAGGGEAAAIMTSLL
ncbi:MAG: small multi-drug export protein [Clostridia bacterium]|nr:small multi-drug export protein [Clostridia bacterium]